MTKFINVIILQIFLLLSIIPSIFGEDKIKSLKLNLTDFSIVFPSIEIDKYYYLKVEQEKNDTTVISLELGDTPENKTITILGGNVEILNVYQKFETSITVMNEGPHLDLLEWNHYISDWVKLDKTDKNSFQTNGYNEEESNRFPEVSVPEIKQAVLKLGGERWYKLVSNIKSCTDYPCNVGISKIFFRIDYLKENSKHSKNLVFNIPMGC